MVCLVCNAAALLNLVLDIFGRLIILIYGFDKCEQSLICVHNNGVKMTKAELESEKKEQS